MINLSLLLENFNNITVENDYILVNDDLIEVLKFLKTKLEYDFDMLTSIFATDYIDYIQLVYILYSTNQNVFLNIAIRVKCSAKSVVSIYKSANYDECEIFDLFGLTFEGNKNLKRLYLPENWKGHPLLKSYKLEDERLVWND